MNAIATRPKLVTLGIGLAITFTIGTAIGMVDHNQMFALSQTSGQAQGQANR